MKDEKAVDDGAHDDVEYTSLDLKSIRRNHWSWNLLAFSTGCLSTVALLAVAFFIHRSLAAAPKSSAEIEAEEWNHCGRSSAVAKARECVMEPMFYGWMPPQCVYEELTRQYPVFEDRKYYIDPNLTEELRPEQLWAGEHSVVYTSRYHDEHCLFQWRKLQYAMDHQMEFVDNKTISARHSKHCADQLSQTCEAVLQTTNYVELGFYRCRKTIW